jgi:hypothetical protein
MLLEQPPLEHALRRTLTWRDFLDLVYWRDSSAFNGGTFRTEDGGADVEMIKASFKCPSCHKEMSFVEAIHWGLTIVCNAPWPCLDSDAEHSRI